MITGAQGGAVVTGDEEMEEHEDMEEDFFLDQ